MCKISLTHEAISLLRSYPWPGNIRQLQGFTQSLTSLESQKVTPLSGRVEIDAQTLAQYMPAATETLPATVPGDGGAAPGSPEDMQKIVQAIVFLKQEVDALKQAVYHGHAAGHIPALPAASDEEPAPDRQPEEEDLSIKKITGEMIVRALEKHAGNRKLAARELGISERTLYRKLPAEYRSDNKNKR